MLSLSPIAVTPHRPSLGLWLPTGPDPDLFANRGVAEPSCLSPCHPTQRLGDRSVPGTPKRLIPGPPLSAGAVTRGYDRSERMQRHLSWDVEQDKTSLAISKASVRASPELCVLVPSSP